jgi:LytS/YehU family sensor histidine kinase
VQLEIEKLNLEKDFLKAQLNPHFLFNTLNNLYGLALRNDYQTPQVIMHLSEIMRYTLYESNAELVPLTREVEFLKNYVLLEKMRFKNNKNIDFTLDDSNMDTQMIAPLLTFTFVENSFKYGLKPKNDGFLKINVSVDNNIFYFSIINDKEENRREREFSGIGTVNIRKRLELLYPGKHELKIEDQGKSFFVEMKINLQSNERHY